MSKFLASRVLLAASVTMAMFFPGLAARAQTYPSHAITLIVPFAGGSASDVVTRIMVNKMSQTMGQPIVVDNRPGAGGNIGIDLVVKAAPDGYTLLVNGNSVWVYPLLRSARAPAQKSQGRLGTAIPTLMSSSVRNRKAGRGIRGRRG